MSTGAAHADDDRHELLALRPYRVEAFELSAPLTVPRRNAFGEMTHRPALIVRLIDVDGAEGWGECFCNWPSFGAAHRKQVIFHLLAPLLDGKSFDDPEALSTYLTERTRSLRVQCNEPGPFEQAIAALDIAAWDLTARRASRPLFEALGGAPGGQQIPVYASALGADTIDQIVPENLERGVQAFKLKVGFGEDADRQAVARLRDAAGLDARLMVDANQAWRPEQAAAAIDRLAEVGLDWIEEPISAEADLGTWRTLARASPVPLAAGENMRGLLVFSSFAETGVLGVIQPDVIKWGGLSGCRRVAGTALQAGQRFCPHYLGGGLGLLASAHLLASTGGGDLLELDASENPLIPALAGERAGIVNGCLMLDDSPGLGVAPDLDRLKPLLVGG